MPRVVMVGESSDESNLGGVAAIAGCSMAIEDHAVSILRRTWLCERWLSLVLVLASTAPIAAQSTQPVWWPPTSLYGRPLSSPFFEFPPWARYTYCRPAPLAWGFDPFPNYGACDGAPIYPDINCPGNFVAHRPNAWYFMADFAPATVDFQNTRAIAELGINGPVVLSTSDLQPNFDAGTRLTIGRRLFGCYRLEGTYWGSFKWSDYAAVQNSSGVGGAGTLNTLLSGGLTNAAVAGLDNDNFVSAQNSTRMNNAELNLLYWIDMPPGGLDVSLLLGGRYLDIRDQFNLVASNTAQQNRLQVNTTNPIWCLQTGLATDWLIATRMWINFTIKGAVCTNHVTLDNNFTTTAGGASTINLTSAVQNRTTWLGDLNLTANLQMTPWLVARIGYQALFVDGVAVASDNIQTNNALLTNGPAQVNARSNAIFHGPIVGIMGNW